MIYSENALILAPLSGFTDAVYRRIARSCGCQYAFTEMVDAASLAYASARSQPLLYRAPDEKFLGVQLVGSDPEQLKRAAEVLNAHDFSLLDFNLGCPVPKVFKKGAGAALGRNLELALKCFAALREVSKFPLTAKLRIVSAEDPAPTLELCRGLAEIGARAITIHGRTREAFYTGAVSFDIIRAVREALPGVEVIANGGVKSAADCQAMREKTGCTKVMLAQGAMGNPWLFREIADGLPPTLDEWRKTVIGHIDGMIGLYGESSALVFGRKIVHDYLKGRGFPGSARAAASTLTTRAQLIELVGAAAPAAAAPPDGRRII